MLRFLRTSAEKFCERDGPYRITDCGIVQLRPQAGTASNASTTGQQEPIDYWRRVRPLENIDLRLKLRDPFELQIEIAPCLPQLRPDLVDDAAQTSIGAAIAP